MKAMVGYCIAALGNVGCPVNTSRILTAKDSGLNGFGRYATSCSSTPRREITSSGYPDMKSTFSSGARVRMCSDSVLPFIPGRMTPDPPINQIPLKSVWRQQCSRMLRNVTEQLERLVAIQDLKRLWCISLAAFRLAAATRGP